MPGDHQVARFVERGVGVGSNIVAGDPGQGGIVRADSVGAGRAAGGANAGHDIAGLCRIVCSRDCIGVVACGRHVVDYADRKGCRSGVAIGIRHDHLEVVRRVVARGIVGQRVAVAIVTWRNAGDGQHAARGCEGLANRRNADTVEGNRSQTIGRLKYD